MGMVLRFSLVQSVVTFVGMLDQIPLFHSAIRLLNAPPDASGLCKGVHFALPSFAYDPDRDPAGSKAGRLRPGSYQWTDSSAYTWSGSVYRIPFSSNSEVSSRDVNLV